MEDLMHRIRGAIILEDAEEKQFEGAAIMSDSPEHNSGGWI